jgi:hypothetical protein
MDKSIRTSWNKGKTGGLLSVEHKKKISESLKGKVGNNTGKKFSEETKQKMSAAQKARKYSPSEESRQKMSEAKKGKPSWNAGKKMNEAWGKRISEMLTGKKLSEETKTKLSAKNRKDSLDWHAYLYQDWRTAVFERDDYTCQHCRIKDDLHAHHIVDYKLEGKKKDTNLMFDVDNGLTLCNSCHAKLHVLQGDNGFTKGYTPWNKGLTGVKTSGPKRDKKQVKQSTKEN